MEASMLESTLVAILIICLVFGLLWYAIQYLPENPFKKIASIAVVVIGIVLIVIKLLAFI